MDNKMLKWLGTILVVVGVIMNAFDDIYNYVYPLNVIIAILSGLLLMYVAQRDGDSAYLVLNLSTTLVYVSGLILSMV